MRLPRLLAMVVLAPLLGAGAAHADDITSRLDRYEQEVRALGSNLPMPNQRTQSASQHRLVDAEVAYSLGDYDTAALQLFDLAAKEQGADKEAATFYLAESLYEKGDLGTAHTYFKQLIDSSAPQSKYHTQSLERLIEIAIAQHDTSNDTAALLGALQSSAASSPGVPYVLGKYAFAQGNYDNALQLFAAVPKGSDYELQAEYYTGTTYVAKQDLAKATDTFANLIDRKPKTNNDRRVIELGQLALGRLYYEREQPAKSIDAYLLVDRHSDLFPDALYEVAWVYVKSKQYDKALRALELLEQSDPSTIKTPTVRILEGNLRIRKAQMLRQQQVNGTINNEEHSDPAQEYDKAAQLFTQTHDQYVPAYTALAQAVDGKLDPAAFIDQIAGRSRHVFQLAAPVPEAAVQMLRDEPNVQVFDSSEDDLSQIQADIRDSEEIIARLDAIIASGDRTAIYPAIAARRSRIAQIQDDLIAIRAQLADQQNDNGGETATRRQLAQQYAALGNPEQAYTQRVSQAQDGYDGLDATATEIAGAIDSAQATAVALRKWANEAKPPMADDAKQKLGQGLDDAAKEAQAIEDELAGLRREIALGKDLATLGDDQIKQARTMRKQVQAAEDAEQRALASRGRSSPALDRAARLALSLDQLDQTLDAAVAQGLEQIKAQLVDERKQLADYKTELAADEQEAREAGAAVLGASFKDVKAKLYDIVVRTDVGNVDVAWSQKEDIDDDLKRLNLARSRELKQLKDEFKDILIESAPQPVTRKAPPTEGTEGAPQTSPDKGGGKADERVKPTGGGTQQPAQPTVKPDESKGQPKTQPKTQPKKGGAK
ncbi:MAG: tetratricopeptide repeat protein [Acidobacteriota bacterium]